MQKNLPEQDVHTPSNELSLFEEEIDNKKVFIADVRRKLCQQTNKKTEYWENMEKMQRAGRRANIES